MSCPFAHRCPSYEAFAHQAKLQHLAWAFCWGEYCDCNHYKCMVAGERASDALGSGLEAEAMAQKERILGRLRASLLDLPMRTW